MGNSLRRSICQNMFIAILNINRLCSRYISTLYAGNDQYYEVYKEALNAAYKRRFLMADELSMHFSSVFTREVISALPTPVTKFN